METTESIEPSRASRKPSWPKILSRDLPSGNIQYRIDVLVDGHRIHESFPTEAQAVKRAWELDRERQQKGKVAFLLPVEDRVVASRCLEKLKPFDVTLEQATDYYIAHIAKFRQAPLVRKIADRVVDQADKAGRSPNTVIDLRHRLKSFTAAFGDQQLAEISFEDLEQWASSIKLSPCSRRHTLTKVSQLYRYALKHGWCAENLTAKLTRPETRTGIPHHLSVEESARLLTQASAHDLTAFVGLGLFAGIRPDEIRRLAWDKVRFTNKVVILDQTVTKTGQHRVVELHPTALAWLKTCTKSSGRIVDMPEITFKRQWKALRVAAGFKHWNNDDMRHTCATYSCALTGDYAKVAADLGHDVRVLHRHYRGLATKTEAERFFKLTPAKVTKGKIVTMPTTVDTESTTTTATSKIMPMKQASTGADQRTLKV